MTNPLKTLQEYGQSVWLDFLSRDLLRSGELKRLIAEDGLRGMTSNPSIFEKAIGHGEDYDAQIAELEASGDLDPGTLFERLAVTDIQTAADALRPVYDQTQGRDGYVSIEVSPYLAMQTFSAWGERVIITPWRHRQAAGGIAIDMGVHYADILEYLLGPIQHVVGMGALVDPVRVAPDGSQVIADAEDLTVGVARFASGALASWTLDLAGRGAELYTRRIHGTSGTLTVPNDRTGQPLAMTVTRNGAPCTVSPVDQLASIPDFTLDATTAALFSGERLASYDLPWTDIDANLLAIELDDFARAISTGDAPEVSGEMGLRSLAIAYGFLESERAGRILTVEEILDGRVTPYQDAIEAMLAESVLRRADAG